jgi:hypothetical protein
MASPCCVSTQALDSAAVDAVSLGVLAEAVNLLLVLLHKLRLIGGEAFELFFKRHDRTGIALINQPQNHYHSEARRPPLCVCFDSMPAQRPHLASH